MSKLTHNLLIPFSSQVRKGGGRKRTARKKQRPRSPVTADEESEESSLSTESDVAPRRARESRGYRGVERRFGPSSPTTRRRLKNLVGLESQIRSVLATVETLKDVSKKSAETALEALLSSPGQGQLVEVGARAQDLVSPAREVAAGKYLGSRRLDNT